MKNTKLLPFRSYEEEDVVNLFSLHPMYASESTNLNSQTEIRNDGAAGTFVKIENGNFNQDIVDYQHPDFLGKSNQNGFNGYGNAAVSTSRPLPFVVSETYPVNPLNIMPTEGYDMPLGITLNTTAIGDENGEKLLYNKMKKEELQAILPGETVPVATKGVFTFHVESFDGAAIAQDDGGDTFGVSTDGVDGEFRLNIMSVTETLYPRLKKDGTDFNDLRFRVVVSCLTTAGTLIRTNLANGSSSSNVGFSTQTKNNEWEDHTFIQNDNQGFAMIFGTSDGNDYTQAHWRNLRVYDADTGNLIILCMLNDTDVTLAVGDLIPNGVNLQSNSPSEFTPVGRVTLDSYNSYSGGCRKSNLGIKYGFAHQTGVSVINSGIKTSSSYGPINGYDGLHYIDGTDQVFTRELGKIAICKPTDPFCFGTIIGTGSMHSEKTDGIYSDIFWKNTLPIGQKDDSKINYYMIKIGK
jgi:hypothetical protein